MNRRASELVAYAVAAGGPLPELVRRLTAVPATGDDEGWFDVAYNPMGRLLLAPEGRIWEGYVARVADLEGIRRAALLTAELRGRSIPPERAASDVAAHFLRNPYTAEPFIWDEARSEIVFAGLDRTTRRRHAFRL